MPFILNQTALFTMIKLCIFSNSLALPLKESFPVPIFLFWKAKKPSSIWDEGLINFFLYRLALERILSSAHFSLQKCKKPSPIRDEGFLRFGRKMGLARVERATK